eukprot:CAMPEP_0197628710 /NCGR_PEP_ID=MMETSP1338-20131121/6895_1 /TAXON_ID=43686 ORGANISM="Pelagodinium beii, Strain RCC1491" /NCGR_SAMPLE_ID=MMETSP1338 /ASSEMBLY_ACC=CAM_ASM_000754 /LENGTH=934 /DNA_ID=CAMNT_0043199703 /DNA_START=24 /DNA_END=2828 /DNA_ORIENTATION=+
MEIDDESEYDSDDEDGDARRRLCEAVRIHYKDPVSDVPRSEDVFLDPRDAWSSGNNLLLVNAAQVSALQKNADKEQNFAISSQFATERCRRDYLREQQYNLEQLRNLLKTVPNVPKNMAAEANTAIEKAMEVAEKIEDDMVNVTPEDLKIATEWYVPKHDTDDELVRYLKQAEFDMGDETSVRLLLKKMRNTHKDTLRERDAMKKKLEAIEGSGSDEGQGPTDAASKLKLIHSMIIQAQNEGASWTEIAMNIIDAAAVKWRQQKKEDEEVGGKSPNILQITEDAMSGGLRAQLQAMIARQQEIEPRLKNFYQMLAQQEMQAASLMEMKAQAESAEEKLGKKQAAAKQQAEILEKRRQEKKAKLERAKAAKAERKQKQREAERAELEAAKADALGPGGGRFGAPAEVPTGAALVKLMSKEQQVQLKKLEQAAAQSQAKKKTMSQKMQELKTEVADAQEVKKANKERAAVAREMLEQKVKEAKQAETKAQEAKQKREVLMKEVQQMAEQKGQMQKKVKAANAPIPPDIEGDITKLEMDIEKAEVPYQELREEEHQVWAKERDLERKLEEARTALRAKLGAPEEEEAPPEKVQPVPTSTQLRQTRERETDPMLMGYHERVKAPDYAEMPRHVQLHTDTRARERQLHKKKEAIYEEEAEQLLARLPKTDEEDLHSRSTHASLSQAPVWFRRNEDIRVKLALAKQSVAEVEEVLSGVNQRVKELKQDLKKRGKELNRNIAETSELYLEAATAFSDAVATSRSPDSAMREQLQLALREHQVCSARATDAWNLAETGAEIGAKQQKLELEELACNAMEEDLLRACQNLYSTATQAVVDGPEQVIPIARQFAADWEDAESRLRGSKWKQTVWPSIYRASARLDAERGTQDGLNTLLQIESKRRSLLDAELVAPPEAKRALAAMRHAAAQETTQLGDRMQNQD